MWVKDKTWIMKVKENAKITGWMIKKINELIKAFEIITGKTERKIKIRKIRTLEKNSEINNLALITVNTIFA